MLNLSEQVKPEGEQFTLFCDSKCKAECIRLCTLLEQRMAEIMQFFQLKKLSEKPAIYMTSERLVFRSHVEEIAKRYEGVEYFDWMIADTYDGDINILSLEACRESGAHRCMSQEEHDKVIIHEFVHICQRHCFHRAIEQDKFCGWFWEALATNLSGQEYIDVAMDCTVEQLLKEFPNMSNSYAQAYHIGKYMLLHMEHEKILEYVYFPEKLVEDIKGILEDVRMWTGEERDKL